MVPSADGIRTPHGGVYYDEQGRKRLAPLEADSDFPYGVAESGMHLVRIR